MGSEGASSVAVMADAQLTTVRVLKPFINFEEVYQGQSSLIPIAFPGTRDLRANQATGFDPNLMAGIPVPQGSRVLLWLPQCFADDPQEPLDPFQLYSYRLIWRYQNLAGYRDPSAMAKREPYHFARQSPGAPDTTIGGVPIPRITIPACWHVIAYESTEPLLGASGSLTVHVEEIIPRLNSLTQFVQPLMPNGQLGVIQQGVADPATVPGTVMPGFVPFMTDAQGDELIILANRVGASSEEGNVWDFTDPELDLAFSNIYGTGNGTHAVFRDTGIYLQTGSMP